MDQKERLSFSCYPLVILFAVFLGTAEPASVHAQSQVQATITGIPQILPSPYISDFEQNIFSGNYQVHLSISGQSSVQLQFRVQVRLDGELLVDELSLPVTFDSGFHVLSPFSEFVEFEATTRQILEQLPGNRFRQAWQTGSFPEGNYTITIEPDILGSAMPGIEGVANFMVRFPQPPELISPSNGAILSETTDTPVFTWLPVMGPGGMNTEYEFHLVELFDDQRPGDGIVSNREYASVTRIGTNMLPYTGDVLPLEKGKTYAWQVTARDVNNEIPIKNEGQSEIFVFTFGEEEDEQEEELEPVVVESSEPEFPTAIPVTTISGEAQFRFSETEGGNGVTPLYPEAYENMQVTDDSNVAAATLDPNYRYGSGPGFNSSASGRGVPVGDETSEEGETQALFFGSNMAAVFGGGSTAAKKGNFDAVTEDMQQQLNDLVEQMNNHPLEGADVKAVFINNEGNETVIASTEVDEDGNFLLSFVPSEVASVVSSASTETVPSEEPEEENNQNFLNSANLNPQQIPAPNVDLSVATIKIRVSHRYFTTESKDIVVRTNNPLNYDLGTFNHKAKTYRLNATVFDADTENEIPDATIEIFRASDWYDLVPALRHEGFPNPPSTEENEERIQGKVYQRVAQTSAANDITRLFPGIRGRNDRYAVRVQAPGYEPLITHLSANPGIEENDIVTVEKTYELLESLPVVEGRVVRSDNQAPVADVPVTLHAPGSNGQGMSISSYIATTDSEGRFVISDIPTNNEPYELVVSGSNVGSHSEELLLNERGIRIERDPIMLDPVLISVVGRVVNDEGIAVANAMVRWEEGGTPVQTDQYGRFVTANTEGTHRLQIRKIAHRDLDTTLTVQVEEEPEFSYSPPAYGTNWAQSTSTNFGNSAAQWANAINNTSTFQSEEEGFFPGKNGFSGTIGNAFNLSGADVEEAANNQGITADQFEDAASYLIYLLGDEGAPGGIQDAGTFTINRSVGKLDVVVRSEQNNDPIPDATVSVGRSGPEGATDSDGSIYFGEAPGGTVSLHIEPSETTNFVPFTTEVTITDNGDTTSVQIQLELGGRAEGRVLAAGSPVEEATIRVEGREDIETTTDSNGNYSLPGVPAGEWTLRASKSGFVGESQTETFTEDQTETVNFTLQDSEFNIASLLGFEIEVDELSTASDTTISGAFVSISSNALFEVSDRLRIPFSDINVYEENGELMPVGGEVITDVSEMEAQIFDFLHVTISNGDGLAVRPRQIGSAGYIAGQVELDYEATFTSATGWEWPDAADQHVILPNTGDLPEGLADDELVTLTSDGSFPFPDVSVPDFELSFGSASEMFSLYGFDVTLSLNESVLRNDGFHMNGDVQLAGIPLLDDATVTLDELWIGTDGTVREASLDLNPHPELALADWKMELMSGALSEAGFSFGGAVELNIPGSDPADISFSDLSISPDQIFGGEFVFPSGGIDVFGVVDLQSRPGTDISFGKVQNEDIYYVTGAAEISLPKYVDENLVFNNFLIRTDGEFNANIAANFETDFFGLADLSVNGVEFRNINTPEIYVDGQFGLRNVPFISAQAGGITYQPGGDVSFDEIDLSFDLASIGEVGAGIGLVDEPNLKGFSGSGNMAISGTSIDAGIDFFYNRISGTQTGFEIGATIEAGTSVPVGTFTIEEMSGGFEYNTSNNDFLVSLGGSLTVAPNASQAVSLDMDVTVESGPVITGNADVTVMSEDLANASLLLDFPNSLFAVETTLDFSPMEGVNLKGSAEASALMVLNGAQNGYWMLGARAQFELLDLFDTNANILAAWNYPRRIRVESSTQRMEGESNYTAFMRDGREGFFSSGGNTISGIFMSAEVEIGRPPSNPKSFDLELAGVSLARLEGYMYSQSECKLKLDFSNNNYGFAMGSTWQAGGALYIYKWEAASIHGRASGHVGGGYENGNWWADGGANGRIWGSVGSCGSGCNTRICWKKKIIPKGAQGCVRAGVNLEYNSSTGLDISFNRN